MEAIIQTKFAALQGVMDERSRRLWAATEAQVIGRGGPTVVARATGLSRNTVYSGLKELNEGSPKQQSGRVRRRGGGRKALTEKDTALLSDLEALVEPSTRGDPESPLRWTVKSVRHLAAELGAQGHQVQRQKVAYLIASTSTRKGLKIQAELDTGSYPTGIKVSDQQIREIQMTQASFHGEWNYTITPRRSQSSV